MKDFLKARLRNLFFKLMYLSYTLIQYTKYLLFNKPISVEFLKTDDNSKNKQLCLFVVYAAELQDNHLRALNALYESGYEVVLIANCELSLDETQKQKLYGLLYNHNIGRDIGGFCRAMSYIYENDLLDGFNKVLFLNDSIIFLDKCKTHFAQFAQTEQNYTGITRIEVLATHIPSWCFQLSRKCLLEPRLMNFFKTFLPLNSRRHLIIGGEIRLSQTIVGLGYKPEILDKFSLALDYKKLNAFYFPKLTFLQLANEIFGEEITINQGTQDYENVETIIKNLEVETSCSDRLIETVYLVGSFDRIINRMHMFNLNAVLYNDFPFIKRDLYHRGLYTKSTLEAFVKELRQQEGDKIADEFVNTVLSKECVDHMPYMKRKLTNYGII